MIDPILPPVFATKYMMTIVYLSIAQEAAMLPTFQYFPQHLYNSQAECQAESQQVRKQVKVGQVSVHCFRVKEKTTQK